MNAIYLEIAVKYVHFISIFIIVAALSGEHILLKKALSRKEIGRISRLDGIYGIASLSLLAAGFTLWFWIGKPADFYSKNPIFMVKLSLFIIIGLLSIKPTIYFIKQRKGNPEEVINIPAWIKNTINLELILLFLIPLLASLMAKGIGLNAM